MPIGFLLVQKTLCPLESFTEFVPSLALMHDLASSAGNSADILDARLAIDRAVFADLCRGVALEEALTILCHAVEQQSPGLLCSVLILDPSGSQLFLGAAPSLPEAYARASNGIPIGPYAGACGTAAFRKEPVIVSDIAQDPLFADHKELPLKYGLRACWSTPVISSKSNVLGTFALYYREARLPTTLEQQLVNWAAPLVALTVERKQAEDSLEQQRAELQIILDASPAMIWYKDKHNRILRANQAAAASLGLQRLEVEGRSASELFPDKSAQHYEEDLQVIASGKPNLGIRESYQTAPGKERWVITDRVPYRDHNGRIIGVIVFSRDVTEQHAAEMALQHTKEHLSLALECSGMCSWDCDVTTGQVYLSESWSVMLGGEPKETRITVKELLQITHPADQERIWQTALGVFKGSIDQYREEHRVRNLRGEWIWLESLGKVVARDAQGRALRAMGTNLDITKRKHAEETLRKSELHIQSMQKMEAVGRLAGGIAHDFNNLLMVVSGQLELLKDQLAANANVRKIERAQKAAARAISLTRQLLAFSRMQSLHPEILDLNTVVTEMNKLIPPLVGPNINVDIKLDPGLSSVKADRGQLEQIILNLVVNARDAMPEGGSLLIETANVELDAEFVLLHPPMTAGPYVLLTVKDTGIGMDAETQAHLFEPFFTTKERGKGTGLGLASVFGIVQQSGGNIWVDSSPGRGTTIRVYLPLAPGSGKVNHSVQACEQPARGTETVLLTEDQSEVRELAREFLQMSGYKVLEAKHAAEAIEVAKTYPGRIHLLLTDMVMPGISGKELGSQIAALRPETKLIYMSGYSELPLHEEGHSAPRVLQKPFTRLTLARAVRDALDDKT